MKKNIFIIFILSVCFLGLKAQSPDKILYTGRFDFSDPSTPVFSHVGTSIKANFVGTSISAEFSSAYGTSYLYVIIDGNADPKNRDLIKISNATAQLFSLASDLSDGEHQIEIIKTNQYDTKVRFHGFNIEDTNLGSKPERPSLSIEFYGDSNPAGHSAWDVLDKGAIIDNGGYYTYPAITARLLGAEFSNISMGGAGITDYAWRNLVDVHHLIHMDDPAEGSNLWDYSNNKPNVVVINLGANDYYAGANKYSVKNNWKEFIKIRLRSYYPDAHIILANSYGWAYNEPTDYIHEAIEDLNAEGENNVSYVKFPWLWGQEHAVVNEHAGFANILAQHIANKLNIEQPNLSELSSFASYGELSNTSLEKSTLDGVADGWRSHGNVTLVENVSDAVDGTYYLTLYNTAWVNFANDAQPGHTFTIKGWLRGANNGDKGKLKLEFKDQAQKTIATEEGLQILSTEWQEFTTTATAPEGTWSVWVVLVAENQDNVDFDNISMSWSDDGTTGLEENAKIKNITNIVVYPNPNNGNNINIAGFLEKKGYLRIYDMAGKLVYRNKLDESKQQEVHIPNKLKPGIYSMIVETKTEVFKTKIIVK